MAVVPPFDDFVAAPNISSDPATYELENLALQRDGRLDRALFEMAPWTGKVLLDIGCGTGFWLMPYAQDAARVIGVEPDAQLLSLARRRCSQLKTVEVMPGSAEHLPLGDDEIDVVHARFAYFFGEGAEAGLAEALRVLRPAGTLLVVDNSWTGGDFADLLRRATNGNAAIDPARAAHWWADRGTVRHEVHSGWQAESREELQRILHLEFPADVVDEFMLNHRSASLTYRFAVYEVTAPESG